MATELLKHVRLLLKGVKGKFINPLWWPTGQSIGALLPWLLGPALVGVTRGSHGLSGGHESSAHAPVNTC